MARLDRAITDSVNKGFARILVGKGRVLGAGLVGPRAGELVHELALAMQVNTKAKTITEMMHAYPGYAQIHRRAINSSYAHLLQTRKVRILVWLLNRLLP